jgi:hypothetical protein
VYILRLCAWLKLKVYGTVAFKSSTLLIEHGYHKRYDLNCTQNWIISSIKNSLSSFNQINFMFRVDVRQKVKSLNLLYSRLAQFSVYIPN